MITLYLVRHGQTVWNSSGRYQGRTDVALSDLGLAQAKQTALWFKDVPLDGVITSPLIRASKTAEGIADIRHLPLEKDDRLKELSFGDWEGKTYDEIEAIWPGMIEAMYHDAGDLQLPHGESFEDCRKRCMEAVHDIIGRGDNKTWTIVCHGAALRTIICSMIHIPLSRCWNLALSNACISAIQVYPGDMNVLYMLNSTDHLKGMKSGS
ncbi:alpha-ribazole phosphatase [uncultured Dialister sp.]|nr:alpha-ribazole phosphatase [uncultured Dialister sp.]